MNRRFNLHLYIKETVPVLKIITSNFKTEKNPPLRGGQGGVAGAMDDLE